VHAADVAPVYFRDVSHHFLVERRAVGVHVPALDAEAVLQALDREGLAHVGVLLGAAQGLGMHESEVREVGEVVARSAGSSPVVQVIRHAAPRRVVQIRNIDNEGGIGFGGVAGQIHTTCWRSTTG